MGQQRFRHPWEGDDVRQTRVLVECASDTDATLLDLLAHHHGYAVRTCVDPEAAGCDLLEFGACALIDGADVAVNMLRPTRHGRRVLDQVLLQRRPPAVVADVAITTTEPTVPFAPGTLESEPDQVTTVEPPATTVELVTAVDVALERRLRAAPWWGEGFG